MSKPDTSRVDMASWQEGIEAEWRKADLPESFLGNGGSNHKLYAFAAAISALTPPEHAASPSGESRWRMVPVEPTEEMVEAGRGAFYDADAGRTPGPASENTPYRRAFRLMLAAAPPAPHVPAESGEVERLADPLAQMRAEQPDWITRARIAEARIRDLEAEAAASRAEVERLTKERDDADRRAGAAERTMERLREDAVSRADWLWKAKRARGYSQNTSFDVVWAETCKSADRAASLEAIVREIVPPNGFNVDPELLERARALLDPTVSNTKEDGHGR